MQIYRKVYFSSIGGNGGEVSGTKHHVRKWHRADQIGRAHEGQLLTQSGHGRLHDPERYHAGKSDAFGQNWLPIVRMQHTYRSSQGRRQFGGV